MLFRSIKTEHLQNLHKCNVKLLDKGICSGSELLHTAMLPLNKKLNTCNYKFVRKKLHIYIPRNIFFRYLLIIHPEFF